MSMTVANNVISGLITVVILLVCAWVIRELIGRRLHREDNTYRAHFLQDYVFQAAELTRCQKANGSLREQLATKTARLRAENLRAQQLEQQLQAARQQPAAPDPDLEPTFTEIVTEIASHVSGLKEEPRSLAERAGVDPVEAAAIQQQWRDDNPELVQTWDTAPEPVDQIIPGTVVTTPTGTDLASEEPARG